MKEFFDEERLEEKYFDGLYGQPCYLSNDVEEIFKSVTDGFATPFTVASKKVEPSGDLDYPFKIIDNFSGELFKFKYCYVRK